MKGPLASVLLLIVLAMGCAPIVQRPVVVQPEPTPPPEPLFSMDILERKIDFLTSVLEREDLLEAEREIATRLLTTYKSIREVSTADLEEVQYRRLVHDLLDKLILLDEIHFSEAKKATTDYSEPISLYMEKKKQILEAHRSADDQGLINYCLELKAAFGPDALTPEIAILFALTLAKQGMRTEAASILEGIEPHLDKSPDSYRLRADIADLHIQQGEREKALQVYEELARMTQEHQANLHALEKRLTEEPRQAPDQETMTVQVEREEEVTPQLEGKIDQLFQKVEKLVQERKFGEAWDLLVLNRNAVSSTVERESIDKALKRLEDAQEEYLEETISMISKKKETLQMARKLLEEEKFQEAISTLDALSGSEDSLEVRELRTEAIESLINRERNRAARLFLTAKRTQDPIKKERYLRTSREILNSLIENYPSSPLSEKIRSHIETVTEELEKLSKDSS